MNQYQFNLKNLQIAELITFSAEKAVWWKSIPFIWNGIFHVKRGKAWKVRSSSKKYRYLCPVLCDQFEPAIDFEFTHRFEPQRCHDSCHNNDNNNNKSKITKVIQVLTHVISSTWISINVYFLTYIESSKKKNWIINDTAIYTSVTCYHMSHQGTRMCCLLFCYIWVLDFALPDYVFGLYIAVLFVLFCLHYCKWITKRWLQKNIVIIMMHTHHNDERFVHVFKFIKRLSTRSKLFVTTENKVIEFLKIKITHAVTKNYGLNKKVNT